MLLVEMMALDAKFTKSLLDALVAFERSIKCLDTIGITSFWRTEAYTS